MIIFGATIRSSLGSGFAYGVNLSGFFPMLAYRYYLLFL